MSLRKLALIALAVVTMGGAARAHGPSEISIGSKVPR